MAHSMQFFQSIESEQLINMVRDIKQLSAGTQQNTLLQQLLALLISTRVTKQTIPLCMKEIKDELCNYILRTANIDLIKNALDRESNLGSIMWMNRGPKECSLETGCLAKLNAKLKKISIEIFEIKPRSANQIRCQFYSILGIRHSKETSTKRTGTICTKQ